MASKKDISSLEALSSTFHDLYKKDPTLDYLTKFEEDRKQLLGLELDSSLFQTQAEEMKKILASSITQSAFDTAEDYNKYATPILSTVDKHDYSALKGLAEVSVSSFLDNDYSSTLKATGLLADSIERANEIGLDSTELYSTQLSDSVEQYFNNDKIKASQGILSLASAINSDLFKTKISATAIGLGSLGLGSASNGLGNAFASTATALGLDSLNSASSALDSLGLGSASNGLGNAFAPIATDIGLSSASLKETMKDLYPLEDTIKPFNMEKISINPPVDFKPLEFPRVQDSPMYKQNEKLIDKSEKQVQAIEAMSKYLIELGEDQGVQADKLNELNNEFLNNSHKQIELMAEISGFLSFQSEILESQRENQVTQANQLNELNNELLNNSHKQIIVMTEVSSYLSSQRAILEAQKETQELQNEHLRIQNEKMEEQIEDNKKSSERALLIAWAGIILGVTIGIISAVTSMYFEYHIYEKEDISDNKNHKELIQVIKENTYEKSYEKLLEQLVLQNKNLNSTNQFLKVKAIENKNTNKQLFKQLTIQNKNIAIINEKLNQKKSDLKSTLQKKKQHYVKP